MTVLDAAIAGAARPDTVLRLTLRTISLPFYINRWFRTYQSLVCSTASTFEPCCSTPSDHVAISKDYQDTVCDDKRYPGPRTGLYSSISICWTEQQDKHGDMGFTASLICTPWRRVRPGRPLGTVHSHARTKLDSIHIPYPPYLRNFATSIGKLTLR